MQLNSIVFPAPNCTYTTEKLFKDLIYIPKAKYAKGETTAIPCLYLPYERETKIMLFFHGNAEDVGIAFDVLQEIRNRLRISILAMEYPGYGLYAGQCSSEKLLEDALYLYDHLINTLGVAPQDIIVFGRSIGSSPACYIARHRQPAALILISPFKSIRELARDLVGWVLSRAIADRFRNIDLIKEVKSPILIIHGQKDKLISYTHSQEMHDNCINSQYAKLLLPPKMTHNDFRFDEDFIDPLSEFFVQIKLDVNNIKRGFTGLHLSDDYYFPPPSIVEYEKKLIKSSIIWDIIEDMKRQEQLKKMKSLPNLKLDSQEAKEYHSVPLSARKERIKASKQVSAVPESLKLEEQKEIKSPIQELLDSPIKKELKLVPDDRVRITINNQILPTRAQSSQEKKKNTHGVILNDPRQKAIFDKLFDDGYEWDHDKSMGVRKTHDRISIKFN